MRRLWTKKADGSAPDGRWYAGDVNALQDAAAGQTDLEQTIALATLVIGQQGLQLNRYGLGEARLSGALRTDGILRALGGLYAGAFTTTQRNGIASPPYGLIILNTTTNEYEWNAGTSATPSWQALGRGTDYGTELPTSGLYIGKRFTLEIPYTPGVTVLPVFWDLIYRPDVFANAPWAVTGGVPLHNWQSVGSASIKMPFAGDYLVSATAWVVSLANDASVGLPYSGYITTNTNYAAGSECIPFTLEKDDVKTVGNSGTNEHGMCAIQAMPIRIRA